MANQETKQHKSEIPVPLDDKGIKALLVTTQDENLKHLKTNLNATERMMRDHLIIVLVVGLLVESAAVVIFSEVLHPVVSLRLPEVWSVATFTMLNSIALSLISTLFMNDRRKLEVQRKQVLTDARAILTNSPTTQTDSLT